MRRSTLYCALFLTSVAGGCREREDIYTTTFPRDLEAEKAAIPDLREVTGPGRLLGALLDHVNAKGEKSTWVFKFAGPAQIVDAHADQIQQFVASTRFVEDEPIWKIPEEWIPTQEGFSGNPELRAKWIVDPKEPDFAIAISQMGPQGLAENVNRWRGQMKQPELEVAAAEATATPLNTVAGPARWVDVRGTYSSGSPQPGMESMAGHGALPDGHPPIGPHQTPQAEPDAGPIRRVPSESEPKFTLPAGWRQAAQQAPFSVATFEAGEPTDATIISVSAVGGPMLLNADRWYKQVGLPSPTDEQLRAALKRAPIGEFVGFMVELQSPAPIQPAKAIVVAMVPIEDGQRWFFKLSGSATAVASQRQAFMQFLGSTRFEP